MGFLGIFGKKETPEEKNAKEIIAKLDVLKSHYFKGLTSILSAMVGFMGVAANENNSLHDRQSSIEVIRRNLSYLQGGADKFKDIPGDADFDSSRAVADLVGQVMEKTAKFLSTSDNNERRQLYAESFKLSEQVTKLGVPFKNIFCRYLNELRSIPSYKNYVVTVIDYRGIAFNLGDICKTLG